MNDQTPPQPNVSQTEQQPYSPISPNNPPEDRKGLLFEILFVLIVLILVFGTLNYFNILRLSEIFPSQLGFLPHKPYEQAKEKEITRVKQSFPTFPPSSTKDQAKQTLTSFLPTILSPSLLPKSNSEIKLTEDKKLKDNFNALWVTKEGIAAANFYTKDSQKIKSLYFQFEEIQPASPSVELAKSVINQVFNIKPKGEWGCRPWINNNRQFCENFWTEGEIKRGVGFVIMTNPTSARIRLIYSFCEYSKESSLYSWKSCRSEFAESGVR